MKSIKILFLFVLLVTCNCWSQSKREELLEAAKQNAYKEDFTAAIRYYDTIISLYPNEPTAYYERGILKANAIDYKGSIADFTRQIKQDATVADYFFLRGISRDKLKQHQAAIADFTQAIRLEPSNSDAYELRGVNKADLNQFGAAEKDFTLAIQKRLDNAKAYADRAELELRKKQYQLALQDCAQALAYDSAQPKALQIKAKTNAFLSHKKADQIK
jgi:tetratricopeptide (TPR) repeat protein